MAAQKKLKMGMVGGGPGAFIGAIHRSAALMDGLIEITAGSFSSNPEKSRQAGEELMLDPSRVYSSYDEMIQKELALPESESESTSSASLLQTTFILILAKKLWKQVSMLSLTNQ
jgi:hypothetical protein